MRRISIIGNAAGGKSTVGRALAKAFDLPYHEIDRHIPIDIAVWGPAERKAFQELHAGLLASPAWVIDGIGPILRLDELFARADAIVHIDLPIEQHVMRAIQRFEAQRTGGIAPDAPGADAPQNFDQLFRNIWGHHESIRPRVLQAIALVAGKKPVFELGSQEAIDAFLVEHGRGRLGR